MKNIGALVTGLTVGIAVAVFAAVKCMPEQYEDFYNQRTAHNISWDFNETEQKVYNKVATYLYKAQNNPDLQRGDSFVVNIERYDLKQDDAIRIIRDCVFHEPYFFWLSENISFEYKTVNKYDAGKSIVKYIILETEQDYSTIQSRAALLNEEIAKCVSAVDEEMSDLEKYGFIYDYLIELVDYNDKVRNKEEIYGCLVDKICNCQGFAYTYAYLCGQIDLPCKVVYGEVVVTVDEGAEELVESFENTTYATMEYKVIEDIESATHVWNVIYLNNKPTVNVSAASVKSSKATSDSADNKTQVYYVDTTLGDKFGLHSTQDIEEDKLQNGYADYWLFR